jgi:diguanylate cyclase (GGDEF)-like protein/PAS domain S-box-containing protein
MRLQRISIRWIAVGCVALIGALWAVTAQRIQFERKHDIQQAIQVNNNLALALEEQTARTIRSVDQTLKILRYEHLRSGGSVSSEFFDMTKGSDRGTYLFVSIVDPDGRVRTGSDVKAPFDVSDRDYFVYHLNNADGGLRLDTPMATRGTGKVAIMATNRMNRPDGSFAGVAAAGIDPDYFARMYQEVDLGPHGFVLLLRQDGRILARHAGSETRPPRDISETLLVQRAAAAGRGHYVSDRDGIVRLISYRAMPDYGQIVAVGTSQEHVLARANERERWYLLGASLGTLFVVLFGAGIVAALRRQKRVMDAAIASEALHRVTYDQAAVGITHNALDGRFLKANPKYCQMTGYTETELKHRTFMDMLHPEDVPSEETMRLLVQQGTHEVENRYLRKDGTLRWSSVVVSVVRNSDGDPDYLVAMVQDITERKRAEAEVERNAHYDALTGMPNRALFFDRLGQTLKHARRKNATVGLLFVDLDRFKNVNDTLGHENGDVLLRAAADRLSCMVRAEDTVARIGGDEFVLLLPEIAETQDAARVAQKVLEAMSAPFVVAGREVFVTASIGIAIFPGDGPEAEALLNNANAAMLRAKQLGRNNLQFYTASLNVRSAEKLLLESDLRRALERREFVLHYQPKLDAREGGLQGFEALIRWRKADGSLVPPGAFIPLLEESGLIVEVGAWVIRAACAQLREWQRAGLAAAPIAVNVSAVQFLRTDLCGLIEAMTREFGIEARLLEIEITESDVMRDPERVVPVLRKLNDMGVRLAIDDFGTGYSSLAYLAKLPIQTLKIDRAFIASMDDEANELTLVSTMISLAHSLKLTVVAEGIETEAQAKLLKLLRCDLLQGYLCGRPMPAAECLPLLKPLSREDAGQKAA